VELHPGWSCIQGGAASRVELHDYRATPGISHKDFREIQGRTGSSGDKA